jgi:hypothetical protein
MDTAHPRRQLNCDPNPSRTATHTELKRAGDLNVYDPKCAELRLYIEPQTADGSPASPMKLADWQTRFARALALPQLLAAFLANDLGLVTSDDPYARFGVLLETAGPLTELIDIGGLKTLRGISSETSSRGGRLPVLAEAQRQSLHENS